MRRARLLRLASLCIIGAAADAVAAPPCGRPCGDDAACLLRVARCHLDRGEPRAAIELLRARRPASEEAALLLARAYLAEGNGFWALRVVHQHLDVHPRACEARSVAAWLHLRNADLRRARALLDEADCPGDAPPLAGRWQLMRGLLSQAEGNVPAAAALFGGARRSAALYAEDAALLDELHASLDPGWLPPLALRAELSFGWTSNGLMSSPTDPGQTGQIGRTPVSGLDLWGRLVPPWGRRLRLSLEGGVRGLGMTDAQARDLSYVSLLARPGLLVGAAPPRLLVAYAGEFLLLAGGDPYGGGPRWFYESHRGELELELPRGVTLFGGAGRVRFRELPRTRTEADAGVGLGRQLGRVAFLGVVSGRVHRAEVPGFDLYGASLLAAATAALPRQLTARGTLVLAFDEYPTSRDYFGVGRDRRDLMVRLSAAVFSPPWRRVFLGVAYEPAVRSSTVDYYGYVDHRLLVKLRWNLEADPWGPSALAPAGHVALWGAGAAAGLGADRIQDLLRQEDAARRGSACVQ
jgi:hypothetical protein